MKNNEIWMMTFEQFYSISGLDRESARRQWNAAWYYRLTHPEEFKF